MTVDTSAVAITVTIDTIRSIDTVRAADTICIHLRAMLLRLNCMWNHYNSMEESKTYLDGCWSDE